MMNISTRAVFMRSAQPGLAWLLRGLLVGLGFAAAHAQGPYEVYEDPAYDVLSRPMTSRDSALFDLTTHHPPNLLRLRIGRWQSTQANTDLFVGVFAGNGAFLRIDLELDGLINPPGDNDPLAFDPFRYGPNPIYGFVELDVDHETETGGEVDAPQYRYLANIARFGGLPAGNAFDDRVARRSSDLDDEFSTEPYIERSGEEFHWALLGNQFADGDIVEKTGNGDITFDAGEDWRIVGDWLHRAHGFEDFSFTIGSLPGEYYPYSVVRFLHDAGSNTTTVTLLSPMTNSGAAIAAGLSPDQDEPLDFDTSNQTSIAEALYELILSAYLTHEFPTYEEEEVLITGWYEREWSEYMNPRLWRPTVLLGTSYTAPGNLFIWSDVYPNVIRGDVDGEYGARLSDRSKIESFIDDYDWIASANDDAVPLSTIGETFDVYDINYDSVVNAIDILLVSPPGDLDSDFDVDMHDLAELQTYQGPKNSILGCILSDINGDEVIDFSDLNWAINTFSGPRP